jgi:hypothetical protein
MAVVWTQDGGQLLAFAQTANLCRECGPPVQESRLYIYAPCRRLRAHRLHTAGAVGGVTMQGEKTPPACTRVCAFAGDSPVDATMTCDREPQRISSCLPLVPCATSV